MASRVLIVGNSGSGKSTYARRIATAQGLAHVDLDTYAWLPSEPPQRRSLEDSLRMLRADLPSDGWVVEGCYADLLGDLSHEADLLIFLNPGVEACVRHCRARPFEAHKYASAEAQHAKLEMLVAWVRSYEAREGPLSLAGHRALYDAFSGEKRELSEPAEWS